MTTNLSPDAQLAFDQDEIQDPQLAQVLFDWYERNEEKKKFVKAATIARDTAKALIEQKELPPGEYRCGSFVVTIKEAQPRKVEFETEQKRQIRFKVAR